MPSYSLANLLMAFKVVLLDIEETVLKNFSNLSALCQLITGKDDMGGKRRNGQLLITYRIP
jgi:hypothetical protein